MERHLLKKNNMVNKLTFCEWLTKLKAIDYQKQQAIKYDKYLKKDKEFIMVWNA